MTPPNRAPSKPRRRWILIGLVAVAAAAILLFVATRRVTFVDFKPAEATGNDYFSSLQHGRIADASLLYSDEFRASQNPNWDRFLADLEAQFGAVETFDLRGRAVVPVSGKGCVALHYEVARKTLASRETLFVCPGLAGAPLRIVGHELVRTDSGQRVSAGLSVEGFGVKLP